MIRLLQVEEYSLAILQDSRLDQVSQPPIPSLAAACPASERVAILGRGVLLGLNFALPTSSAPSSRIGYLVR